MDKVELSQRLLSYGLTLDPNLVLCNRRVVDEAAEALVLSETATIEALQAQVAAKDAENGMRALWRPISELLDIYQQPLMIASPKLIHGDSNVFGISDAYWQDDPDHVDGGEWRCVDFDMCNDEFQTQVLAKADVTHFLIPEGPWTETEIAALGQGEG